MQRSEWPRCAKSCRKQPQKSKGTNESRSPFVRIPTRSAPRSVGFARNALRFRYTMLEAARRRAGEVNQVGALFPWRTINGEEASAYYAAGDMPVALADF